MALDPRSRMKCLLLAFAGLTLLTGCVHYHPEKLEAAGALNDFEARSLDNTNLASFLARNHPDIVPWQPPQKWDLDTLTLVAFYYHPSLDVARAQWQTASAGIRTAGGRPNPTLGLFPGYDFNAASGVSPWIPSVTYDLPIETAGKRKRRLDRAGHLSEAARLNIVTTAWQVRSNLRIALLDLAAASARQKALQAQLQNQQTILQLLEQRLQAGAVAPAELYPARVAVLRARSDLVDSGRQIADARARIAEALGLPLKALQAAEFIFPLDLPAGWNELSSPEIRRAALQGRADLLAALADYAATESALQLEIARQYPDVHLGSNYQWDQGENKWQLGVSFELPLINRNQGPIAEATAKRIEAAARFNALQSKAIGEIDRATATRDAILDQLKQAEQVVETQRQQLATLQASLKAGAADRVEVETAALELRASELVVLDLKIRAHQTVGLLEDALQRPLAAFAHVEVDPKRPVETRQKEARK